MASPDSGNEQRYEHVQHGHFHPILIIVALVMLGSAVFVDALGARLMLFLVAAVIMLLTACFQTLTVRDEGDHLLVRYGPVNLFSRRIPYSVIQTVERARSDVLDGWGIHWLPGRGWIWNLWGLDCVRLTIDGEPTRIGSDDADNLVSFLSTRLAI